MSRFAGMNQSQVYAEGSYFEGPGEYDCLIKDVLDKDTRKSGPACVVELQVLTSSNPDKVPVGAKKSWVQPVNKKDVAFPNLIAFIGAVLGFDSQNAKHTQIVNTEIAPQSEKLLDEACKAKTFNGRKIHVSTFYYTTKGTGLQITRCRFSPLAQTPAT